MSKSKVVLIVDDEEDVLKVLQRALAGDSGRVLTASNVEKAVNLLDAEDVDVLVTDLRMPGLEGTELMRRAKLKNPDTEVIIITGYASTQTAIDAVRLGAFDYILKPFDHVEGVARRIRQALRHQDLVLENRDLVRRLEEMNQGLKNLVVERTRELNDMAKALQTELQDLRGRLREREQAFQDLAATAKRAIVEVEEAARTAGADVVAGVKGRLHRAAEMLSGKLGKPS